MMSASDKPIKSLESFKEGDSLSITETIEDSQLLLYLGLTKDANPLFIQTEYGKTTTYNQPIVPSIMLMGIITSNISKHLPGPGSNVVNLTFNLLKPVYHYDTLTFYFEVVTIDLLKSMMTLAIKAHNYNDDRVLDAMVIVQISQEKDVTEENEL